MTSNLIILDAGHGWKGNRYDPGVVGFGTNKAGHEHVLARWYAAATEVELRSRGVPVVVLPADIGDYDVRHRAVARIVQDRGAKRAIYAQCHLNSGRGSYGLALHDARSRRGRMVATLVSEALERLPGVDGHRIGTVQNDGDGFDRGLFCLDGLWLVERVCGVVVEPFFLDNPEQAKALLNPAGISLLASCLADAFVAALEAP